VRWHGAVLLVQQQSTKLPLGAGLMALWLIAPTAKAAVTFRHL